MEIQLPDGTKIPAHIEINDLKAYSNKNRAAKVGRLISELNLSRRSVIDELQHRLDCYKHAGGKVVEKSIDKTMSAKEEKIHEDYLEEVFGDDAGFKWLSDFPKKCKLYGLKQKPSKAIQKRLQRLHLALLVPIIDKDF